VTTRWLALACGLALSMGWLTGYVIHVERTQWLCTTVSSVLSSNHASGIEQTGVIPAGVCGMLPHLWWMPIDRGNLGLYVPVRTWVRGEGLAKTKPSGVLAPGIPELVTERPEASAKSRRFAPIRQLCK
jgi:hypothetical protein